jgi:predicted O-methyltransferase YrrM
MDIHTYLTSLFAEEDELLSGMNQRLQEKGFPLVSVPPLVGKLLALLVQITGAKKVLEIGTLGGYSAIWMGRALSGEGRLISLEKDEEHAAFAEENLRKAELEGKVEIRVGDALDSLKELRKEGACFDLIFIDADKGNYTRYLEEAIALSHPGSLITADNLLLHGRVLDEQEQGPSPVELRNMNQRLANDPRLEAIILPIGDGVGLARVKD